MEEGFSEYRTLPVIVHAKQLSEPMEVETPHGPLRGLPGDWVIIRENKDRYVYHDDLFRAMHEQVTLHEEVIHSKPQLTHEEVALSEPRRGGDFFNAPHEEVIHQAPYQGTYTAPLAATPTVTTPVTSTGTYATPTGTYAEPYQEPYPVPHETVTPVQPLVQSRQYTIPGRAGVPYPVTHEEVVPTVPHEEVIHGEQ
jgi:hypothetical protein